MFKTILTAAILAAQTTAPTTTTAPETIPETIPEPIETDTGTDCTGFDEITENENDFSEIENTDSIENDILENSIDDSQEFQEPETIPEEIPTVDGTFENPQEEYDFMISASLIIEEPTYTEPQEPEDPEHDTRFATPEEETQYLIENNLIEIDYVSEEPEEIQEPEPIRTQSAYIPHDITREDFPALQTIGYYPGKKPSYIVSVIVCEF